MTRYYENEEEEEEKEEEEERVVYYDLDAESHNRNLRLVPDAVAVPARPRIAVSASAVVAPTKVVEERSGHQIFPRQQLPLFSLDDSGNEADEEKNPFESLLQQQTPKVTELVALDAEKDASCRIAGRNHNNSAVAIGASSSEKQQAISRGSTLGNSGNGDNLRPILKRNQQHNGHTARDNSTSRKKLGFEAAHSRPTRWSTRKPSSTDTKNRRKSLSAILKRRSQLELIVATSRRKSMPANMSDSRVAQNRSTLDDSWNGTCFSSRRRNLSDVLQRATLLSQHHQTTSDEVLFCQQGAKGNVTYDDAILDTEHHMRAERFAPHIFSPNKRASTTNTLSRKFKGDEVVSRIRGGIGDVVRKAIRKSNRELTLLRSHGQHLLPQQSGYSSPMTSIGVVESIQNRAYIVICLTRYCGIISRFVAYECRIHQVTANLEKTTADELKEKHSVVLEAQFHPQTAEYLKLTPGKVLKVFEPLHFFLEHVPAGSVRRPKWFLASTQLTQVVDGYHYCAERQEESNQPILSAMSSTEYYHYEAYLPGFAAQNSSVQPEIQVAMS
ncbi:hypothetical protein DD238_006026 [Peronospora effusa]|uniref:Uncharacterized protein n=1 Tax=Peronospora effusa TaxID=542832 RepID=A0A3M6VDY6_9STRA|nr:hypothetical protein DD238_006026 [Peronospora effusa]RQM13457.1 hypothetical protein DD237_006436 [Peronospora effusa]